MLSWVFGSGRRGAIAACVGGGALLAFGAYLLINPELAHAMRETRGRFPAVILLSLTALAIFQLIEAARHGRIQVGMEELPKSRDLSLFRWHCVGHALVGLGFGSVGLALLR